MQTRGYSQADDLGSHGGVPSIANAVLGSVGHVRFMRMLVTFATALDSFVKSVGSAVGYAVGASCHEKSPIFPYWKKPRSLSHSV